MSIRAAIIRELRSSPLPISTGDLAVICAANRPHASQQVNALMRELERMRVVRRHAPIIRGEGRPSLRWSLVTAGAMGERAA